MHSARFLNVVFQKKDIIFHEAWHRWLELKTAFESMIDLATTELAAALARSAVRCMLKKESQGVITKWHRVAAILHPCRRSLQKFDEMRAAQPQVTLWGANQTIGGLFRQSATSK